jgi:hypothetical protein
MDELLQRQRPPRMSVDVAGTTTYFPISEIEPLEGGGAKVTMSTTDWLDAGTHSAILIDGDTRTKGYLSVYDYRYTGKIEIIAVWRETQP